MMQALFFDCDGVLADTERDGHRVAFNKAFAAEGLAVTWSVSRYGELLTTAGGKERMLRDCAESGWPVPAKARADLIGRLHERKTTFFMELVRAGALPLRPGVVRLVDEALAAGVKLAVCSTSSEKAVQAIVDQLGPDRARHIRVFAGDIVPKKKPDPAIYDLAATTLGVDRARCVVIEDSRNGLRAACAAGMATIVTISTYTGHEDFSGATKVVAALGEEPDVAVRLADCAAACRTRGSASET